MSIIAKPDPKHGFDGKVFQKRISEILPSAKTSYNQQFSEEYEINHAIKAGEWKKLFLHSDIATMDCEDLIDNICEYYNLSSNVKNNLTFSYHSNTSTGKTKKVVCISSGPLLDGRVYIDDTGMIHPIFLDQIKVEKCVPAGTLIHNDVSCNTKFMLNTVHEIGTAICEAFHFINKKEPVYLVLDNAGGHGTNKVKVEFEKILRERYKVRIVWQVPNSPDTNLLDLGAWCTIQSEVEDIHRFLVMDNDVLAKSVENAIQNLDSTKLSNIYNRWERVLDLILKNWGGNDLVERCRGKMKLEEIGEFISNLDKKDAILCDVQPTV